MKTKIELEIQEVMELRHSMITPMYEVMQVPIMISPELYEKRRKIREGIIDKLNSVEYDS